MKVVVSNRNQIGKVNFSKLAKNITSLADLVDVDISTQQDGYVLAYQANTNSYIFTASAASVATVDGGTY
jgi:hypothetical protein